MDRAYIAVASHEDSTAFRLMMLEMGVFVVGSSNTWNEAFDEISHLNPNLLLVDWNLLPGESMNTLTDLRKACLDPLVIILISNKDARQQAAQSVGADFFFSKTDRLDLFGDVVRNAVDFGRVLIPSSWLFNGNGKQRFLIADFKTPQGLIENQNTIKMELKTAIQECGKVGLVASKLIVLWSSYWERAEKFIFPTLGLLPGIIADEREVDLNLTSVISANLKAELPAILYEQKQINLAVEELEDVVYQENKLHYREMIERIKFRLETEQEVYLPGALLVSTFFKIRLAAVTQPAYA